MSSDEDDGSYGFEYSDDDMSTGAVDIENEYYKAKGSVEGGKLEDALAGFQRVVSMEEGKSEWGFKAYKQIVKLQYKLGQHEEMLKSYAAMLTYASGAVTKNAAEKKINSLLDFMSASQETALLQRFYAATLESEEGKSNERLWVKTNLKLCDLWYQTEDFGPLAHALAQLHQKCLTPDGAPDLKKATLLLEVYAIEIQMCSAQRNFRRLKALYERALAIKSAIPHPRIMGAIREHGGKMHMREKAWEAAHTDFFEAFKSYDDAGSPRRVQCLKYLVLASMLMASHVDPFNAQETQPYRTDPQIQAVTALVEAYQQDDIDKFEKVLRRNRAATMDDPFIRPYMEDLMTVLRTQVLLNKVIGPYRRVRLAFLAQKANCSEAEVERLIASLIVDGRVDGRIDQVNQLLLLTPKGGGGAAGEDVEVPSRPRPAILTSWVGALESMQKTLMQRGVGA